MNQRPRVGRYVLERSLGRGGMGEVHLARDPHGKPVAVKLVHGYLADDPLTRERLSREAWSAQQVHHRNVAQLLDCDLTAPEPYLVTEFVDGPPLHDFVFDHGPLRGAALADFCEGLWEALAAIHRVRILHRDVKPGNVLMSSTGPVLIDFGLAQTPEHSRLTRTGLVMGTPGYLAPEVLSGNPPSESSDWWGWAATVAFAATGRDPFGEGALEAITSRVHRGAANLEGVPWEMGAFLARALAPTPSQRPAPRDILECLRDLRRHSGPQQSGGDHTVDRTEPVAPDFQRRRRDARTERADLGPLHMPPQPPGSPMAGAPTDVHRTPPTRTMNVVSADQGDQGSLVPHPDRQATDQHHPDPAEGSRRHLRPTAPVAKSRAQMLRWTGMGAWVLGAMAAPGLAVGVLLVWLLTTRTISRVDLRMMRRRHEFGHRPSDRWVSGIIAPWDLAMAALVTVLSAVPIGLAAFAGLVVPPFLMDGLSDEVSQRISVGIAAVCAVVTAMAVFGHPVRHGARVVVRKASSRPVVVWIVVGVLGAAGLLAAIWMGGHPEPTWSPLPDLG